MQTRSDFGVLLLLSMAATGGCASAGSQNGDAAAECTPVAEQCNGRDDDCDGQVDDLPEASSSCSLPNAEATCAGGRCGVGRCNAGFGDCDGDGANGCETRLASATDCGGCGVACAAPAPLCQAGSCVSTCGGTSTDCGGSCVNTRTDPSNCGGCGIACSLPNATSSCLAAACVVTACDADWGDCDGLAATGCEANFQTDANHCGGCGVACADPTPVCATGACASACGDPALTLCDASCVDTRTDPLHCGACGNACAPAHATAACTGGLCAVGTCDAGWGDCDGTAINGCETDLLTSAADCGACGTACSGATPFCDAGACSVTCGGGRTECSGSCVDTLTDPVNCGGCGIACGFPRATASCSAGACGIGSCDAGWGDCDGSSFNGCEASLATQTNCGACAVRCYLDRATESCATGICALLSCDAGWGDCDGSSSNGCEEEFLTSEAACGGCGRPCAPAEACRAGVCDASGAIVQISAGSRHACAVRASGRGACWGWNDYGQIGDGSSGTDRLVPAEVSSLLSNAVQIAAGRTHTCAVRASGEVACWGYNGHGAIGDGTYTNRTSPTAVSGLSGAVQVTVAGFPVFDRAHSCATLATGAAACWGNNTYGQRGDGTAHNGTSFWTPVRDATGDLADAVQLAAAGKHTCAVRGAGVGSAACWGDSGVSLAPTGYLLGDGSGTGSRVAVGVLGLTGVTQVTAAGIYPAYGYGYLGGWEGGHGCAVHSGGSVSCWGCNDHGQLGDGVGGLSAVASTPVAVVELTDAVNADAGGGGAASGGILDVDAGGHTCAVRRTGEVVCWGRNACGQLGDGTSIDRLVPTTVPGLADAIQVSAGAGFTCALRATGAVECWGCNAYGQLGDGTRSDRAVPGSVIGLP